MKRRFPKQISKLTGYFSRIFLDLLAIDRIGSTIQA
jgi:hypothetical protein